MESSRPSRLVHRESHQRHFIPESRTSPAQKSSSQLHEDEFTSSMPPRIPNNSSSEPGHHLLPGGRRSFQGEDILRLTNNMSTQNPQRPHSNMAQRGAVEQNITSSSVDRASIPPEESGKTEGTTTYVMKFKKKQTGTFKEYSELRRSELRNQNAKESHANPKNTNSNKDKDFYDTQLDTDIGLVTEKKNQISFKNYAKTKSSPKEEVNVASPAAETKENKTEATKNEDWPSEEAPPEKQKKGRCSSCCSRKSKKGKDEKGADNSMLSGLLGLVRQQSTAHLDHRTSSDINKMTSDDDTEVRFKLMDYVIFKDRRYKLLFAKDDSNLEEALDCYSSLLFCQTCMIMEGLRLKKRISDHIVTVIQEKVVNTIDPVTLGMLLNQSDSKPEAMPPFAGAMSPDKANYRFIGKNRPAKGDIKLLTKNLPDHKVIELVNAGKVCNLTGCNSLESLVSNTTWRLGSRKKNS